MEEYMNARLWILALLLAAPLGAEEQDKSFDSGLLALAQDKKGKNAASTGPLAALPSNPGPVLARLVALPDRQFVNLGNPAADAKWGKARGRTWCSFMAVAPDLGGAFLYGEGVHGYIKKDNHYMDDLWFYDWNAHAWICAYPGTPVKELDSWKLDRRGFITTPDGQTPPISALVHAYNVPCYSPDLKKFATIGGISFSCPPILAMFGRLGQSELNQDRRHPFFYDVTKGRWERPLATNGPPGHIEVYGASMIWLPTLQKFHFNHAFASGTWLYDPATNGWT